MVELTQEEIKFIKEFAKNEKETFTLNWKHEREQDKIREENSKIRQKIQNKEYIGNKNAPKFICTTCGKAIVDNYSMGKIFGSGKYKCSCKLPK